MNDEQLLAAHLAAVTMSQTEDRMRRCNRCRKGKLLADFPPPHQVGGPLRPFCTPCTGYIYWATS